MEKLRRARQVVSEGGWRGLIGRVHLQLPMWRVREKGTNDQSLSGGLDIGEAIGLDPDTPQCDDVIGWARRNNADVCVKAEAQTFDRKLPAYFEPGEREYYLPRLKATFAGKYYCVLHKARIVAALGLCILPDGSFATESVYDTNVLAQERKTLAGLRFRFQTKRGVYFSLVDLWQQRAPKNYYHWMHDAVTRLYLVLDDLPPETRFIVNANVAPYAVQTLEVLGIDKSRLQFIQPDEIWELETLWFTPPTQYSGNDIPWVLDWFRTRFQRAAGAVTTPPTRRLFISRRNAKSRRVVNADEIESFLLAQGFEICFPEELTVAEQVRLFAQAILVVGTHGAGFMNLWYMPAGGAVLEILEPTLIHHAYIYWTLCDALGLNWYSFLGESVLNDVGYQDVNVPFDKFQLVYQMMIASLDGLQTEPS